MSKITQLTDKAIGIQIERIEDSFTEYHFIGTDGKLYANYGQIDIPFDTPLPPGSWSILGKGSELTEEQWKGIVEEKWTGYKDYDMPSPQMEGSVPTATESGLSLLKAKSLNPEAILILIDNSKTKP